MKAEELMIGDWFKCTDPTPMQITTIDSWSMGVENQEGYRVKIGDLQPIPLTEEILLKNGFEYEMEKITSTSNGYYIFRLKDFYIDIYTHSYGFGCATINYVHELQHLLRLCGLNDLADNFKIE